MNKAIIKRTAICILLSAWAASPALAQTSTANERLLEELQQITDEAERNRTASVAVIDQLRDLSRRYAWAWNRLIVTDSFDDGNITQNPAWTVSSGIFTPSFGELVSQYTPPAAPQQNAQGNSNDVGAAFLGAVLQSLTQGQGQTAAPQTGPGQASLNTQIPNAFAAVVSLRTQNLNAGGFELGTGQASGAGYRLAVGAGTLTLLRVGAVGSAIVERVNLPAGLDNGQDHTYELTRDTTGELAVTVDGSELMRVRDAGIRESFDRFLFVNNGGEYRLQSVAIYGSP